MSNKRMYLLITISIIMITGLSCSLSLETGGDEKDVGATSAEQTLQAIYVGSTLQARKDLEQPTVAVPEIVSETSTPTHIPHTIVPGNPGPPTQQQDEIDTSNTADKKIALGDSFRLGIFERPFTSEVMDYRKESDLMNLEVAEDEKFYYFSLQINGPGEDGTLSAHYGIEFDTDLDGRGDILLWVKGGNYPGWTIEDVMVLHDSNDDVGGSRPVLPDSNPGNGYDEVIFSADVLNDPDAAWQRIDPSNANILQLAIKKQMVGNTYFLWKAWADSGLIDPSKFDYNDSMSEELAGAPSNASALYPINQLYLLDSTCRAAYKYEPSGNELGGCYKAPPPSSPEQGGSSCRRVCVRPSLSIFGGCLEWATVCN